MPRKFRIELDSQDIGQVLDGLECREESWRRTTQYLEKGEMPDDEFFLAEECSDAEEARWLAGRYRSIIQAIREQMKAQEEKEETEDRCAHRQKTEEKMGMIDDC